MTRALVIGGSRFVGPLLVQRLVQRGYRVTLFNRQSHGTPATSPNVEHIKGDRNIANDLALAASLKPDVVFDNCCYDGRQAEAAVTAFRSVKRFIWTNTVAVYRQPKVFPIVESAPLGPWPLWGSYNANKVDAERRFMTAFHDGAFPAVSVRPTYVLGTGNYIEREAFFVSRLLRQIPVVIPGDGQGIHHFVFADELAEAMARLAEVPGVEGQAFNVASNEAVTQAEFVELCASALGVRAHIQRFDPGDYGLAMPYDPAQASPFPNEHVILSNEKLRRATDLEFQPFPGRLQDVVRWFAARAAQHPFTWRPTEREILARAGHDVRSIP